MGEFFRTTAADRARRATRRLSAPARAARCSATTPSWSAAARPTAERRDLAHGRRPDRGRAGGGRGQGRPLASETSRSRYPRVAEVPFDSDRKRMTTIHRATTAPARELRRLRQGRAGHRAGRCATAYCRTAQIRAADAGQRERDPGTPTTQMASQALRVLGVAYRPLDSAARGAHRREHGARPGLRRPAGHDRPGPARGARRPSHAAKPAGIKTVMITGDYQDTAVAIAQRARTCCSRRATGSSPAPSSTR